MIRIFRSIVPAGLLALAVGCSSAGSAASSGADRSGSAGAAPAAAKPGVAADGSSPDRAVEVPRDTESEGVAWEYAWIREHYGEYRKKEQGLVMNPGGRALDRVTVQLSDGTEKTFYFDISRYFGRF
jgi:hypothetical protein